MLNKRRTAVLCWLAAIAIITVAVLANSTPTEAGGPFGPPTPLCGYSAVWTCTLPSGDVVELAGTRCDIFAFEQRTGATCRL